MNTARKNIAAVLAVMMCLGATSCQAGEDTKWVAKSGDLTVPAGVYINLMMDEYYQVTGDLTDSEPKKFSDVLKETVDGVPVSQKVAENAREQLNQFIAVEQKFDEMGLTLSLEEESAVQNMVDNFWPMYFEDLYTQNGIAQSSYEMVLRNQAKEGMIFRSIYDSNGSEPVPESEIKEAFAKDWAKILVIPLSLSSDEDEATRTENDKKTRDYLDSCYQQLKDGADMEDVRFEAMKKAQNNPDLEKPAPGSSYTFVGRENSSFSQKMVDAVFGAKIGEPVLLEDEKTIYLFVRYDVLENSADLESRRVSILSDLRGDAFEEKLKDWAAQLDVQYNQAALDRYKAENLKGM